MLPDLHRWVLPVLLAPVEQPMALGLPHIQRKPCTNLDGGYEFDRWMLSEWSFQATTRTHRGWHESNGPGSTESSFISRWWFHTFLQLGWNHHSDIFVLLVGDMLGTTMCSNALTLSVWCANDGECISKTCFRHCDVFVNKTSCKSNHSELSKLQVMPEKRWKRSLDRLGCWLPHIEVQVAARQLNCGIPRARKSQFLLGLLPFVKLRNSQLTGWWIGMTIETLHIKILALHMT